ncbi:MAG: hypothetical protein IIV45_11665 [Lachnospiraceae bacterium]|nr:hypothetical protein [Lachnospiraceae bacterium]
MNIFEMLEEIQHKALRDESLKEKILATESTKEPLDEFCKVCQQEGYEIYPMDVIIAGEESYAAMKRSTNGGGENAPMLDGEDDFYELILAALK